jgi:hypothetical protein
MLRLSCARLVLVFALAAALGTPLAVRAEPWANEIQPARLASSSPLRELWILLTGLWREAGCIADPHGGCAAGVEDSLAEAGCGVDPHGGCLAGSSPSSLAKEGCRIDPNGRCAESTSTDVVEAGCRLDPHGGCSR